MAMTSIKRKEITMQTQQLMKVPVTQCDYPSQPRSRLDPDYCLGLGQNMREHGQKVPVIGFFREERFIICDGGCRLEGARLAGIPEVLAHDLGKEPTALELLRSQASIDLYHQHLPPIDRARLFRSICQEQGCTASHLATTLHVSEAVVSRAIALLQLPEDLHQLTHLKDKELASVVTNANRHMAFLDTLSVAASTRASSFDPAELRTGKMTVFLVLPPERMRAQSGLLRMWIGGMLRAVVRGGLQESNKVHFVLDEAASLGRLEVLEDAVDKYRGYGVRLQFFYQSMGQLRQVWKDGLDISLMSNTSQVFFGVNEMDTAEYVSNRLGEETIVVDSGGTSNGSSFQASNPDTGTSRTTSWNSNDNWSLLGRKLLKPEEVTALDQRVAITFTPGIPPLATRLVRYYEEPLGNGPGRFGRLRTRVEVWLAAVPLLGLASVLGVRMTAVLAHPHYQSPYRAAR
jgi:type IV secretion system protein VirD4